MSKASDVISSANLLKSNGWVTATKRNVKRETIVNCFAKYGFTVSTFKLFQDDDDGDNNAFAESQIYIAEISTDSAAKIYLHQDNGEVISVDTIDVNSTP